MTTPAPSKWTPTVLVAVGDDGTCDFTWVGSNEELFDAVKSTMFMAGEHLSAEHIGEVKGIVAELLETGVNRFEGDPPLYLHRVRNDTAVNNIERVEAERDEWKRACGERDIVITEMSRIQAERDAAIDRSSSAEYERDYLLREVNRQRGLCAEKDDNYANLAIECDQLRSASAAKDARIAELEGVLLELTVACELDFGDGEDNESVNDGALDYGHIRRARAALARSKT